jgi:SAM-dependent methyltransferase
LLTNLDDLQRKHIRGLSLETRNWDRQIRLFAHYFLAHAKLPQERFSLLDVGCGTGSALAAIKKIYPYAILYGCDINDEHLALAVYLNKEHGEFFKADIFQITNKYDVIYASNILEHLKNWNDAVGQLLNKCDQLFILVPYKEKIRMLNAALPEVDQHVSSFDKVSFQQFVLSKEFKVQMRVIRTPFAWGHPLWKEMRFRLGTLLGRREYDIERELLVAITRNDINRNAFKSTLITFLNLLKLNCYLMMDNIKRRFNQGE